MHRAHPGAVLGGDGAPLHFGRSLTYRYAALLGTVTGHTPLAPGVSRPGREPAGDFPPPVLLPFPAAHRAGPPPPPWTHPAHAPPGRTTPDTPGAATRTRP